jgi:hypothetical protein
MEVHELPLFPRRKDPLYIVERPIQAISRRLKELHLTPAQALSHLDYHLEELTEDDLRSMLAEEITTPDKVLHTLLSFVGLELAAVRTALTHQEDSLNGGHWFFGERCIYCNWNTYDIAIYDGPEYCLKSPLATATPPAEVPAYLQEASHGS